jgi:ParB family transcriptional regulator, chromosome partitioning protein
MDDLCNIPLKRIYPNPNQPRKSFDEEPLKELSASIGQYGVMEPIIVTPRGDEYMIIAGERRFRASVLAGIEKIPAVIKEADDALVEEMALLENIQREGLNILEEANGYKSLLDRGWTKEKLAEKMGKRPWWIDERLKLLNLSEQFQDMIKAGTLGNMHASELSRLPQDKQHHVYCKIVNGDLNTFNKLRAYVDSLLLLEAQTDLFALQSISEEERQDMNRIETLFRYIEKLIKETDQDNLKKAAFHNTFTPDRIDLIIRHLMKLRKIALSGEAIRNVSQITNTGGIYDAVQHANTERI